MYQELPDVPAGFQRGNRVQIVNIHWIMKKASEFHKTIYFCFIDYAKTFDFVDHNKLKNSLKSESTRPRPNLLRNLYDGQEATVKSGHRTTVWFKTGKGVYQGCILSPYLFNLYAEYTMQTARLD